MRIQVVGAGSWGLALARLLALNGHDVRLWCREEDGPDHLREARESLHFLPGVKLPESVAVSTEIDSSVELAVIVVPSHVLRQVVDRYRFGSETILVSCAKGIEIDTLMLMEDVIRDVLGPSKVVVLSGPSHAEEVARDLPASVCAASRDAGLSLIVQDAFMADTFRVYTSNDVVGVELGGALKNVIAVAAGVCDGLELGDNARAALITRGLAEISRLGVAMGADPLTFSGLSGMGDLIATCTSTHSRNHTVGERLAKGMPVEEATTISHMVAEGVRTAKSAHALAARHRVEMPIAEQVYRLIFEGADARTAIAALMGREAKPERG